MGQEHVTHTLEQALKQGRISHAYLFTGPRGVGKTSIARILAHEINGLPYADDTTPPIDIIEIDAASNRRIDEIRELRDKVYVAPVSAKYKVYIIDEVHMLTKEAFNALLKTLEEPPAHAVFILATTEAHKLPDTIVSRTQRFSFKPVDADKVSKHLADIAKREKIAISPEALSLLAAHGEGSFRDSISLLDQLAGQDKQIDPDDVRRLLGVPPKESIESLIEALDGSRGPAAVVNGLDDLLTAGYQPAGIARQLAERLRWQMVESSTTLPADATLDLLAKLIEVPASHDPARFLELALLRVIPVTGGQSSIHAQEPANPEPPAEAPEAADTGLTPGPDGAKAEVPLDPTPKGRQGKSGDAPLDDKLWPQVLSTLKSSHNTLYGVIRMAEPEFLDDDTIRLKFAFAFHEKRINETSNKKKLSDVIYDLTGKKVKLECVLDKSAEPPEQVQETDKPTTGPQLDAISNIFGTAELLES